LRRLPRSSSADGSFSRIDLHLNIKKPNSIKESMLETRDRLRKELIAAHATPKDSWRGGHIYRLADELADVERLLAESRPRGEHTKDW
jgi:hypothetical protein